MGPMGSAAARPDSACSPLLTQSCLVQPTAAHTAGPRHASLDAYTCLTRTVRPICMQLMIRMGHLRSDTIAVAAIVPTSKQRLKFYGSRFHTYTLAG